MTKYQLIVIGGGPAGLMAAGQAAGQGVKTLLLEKMSNSGQKLRITGKGRCNLTNTAPLSEFISKFGKNGRFLHQAFAKFFSDDLKSFFISLGVDIKTERGGRIFPEGDDAPALTDALIKWTENQGVIIKKNSSVEEIIIEDAIIKGVVINGQNINAKAVIVATGGLSYPGTGSTGDGYIFGKFAGHKIIQTKPSLVPLITKGDTAPSLQGLSLKNVNVKVIIDNKKVTERFGEMLFTHYGLSGPVILQLSGLVIDALRSKKSVTISIDLKPALDEDKLEKRLLRDIQEDSRKQFDTFLRGLLPAKLIPVCADLINIPPDKAVNQITALERKHLRKWLKDFQFKATGHRSYKEAIVTAGGIELKNINPRSMESKFVKGLYFAGEVLDLDGETGGYNLQAAFSTGWLAGQSAALELK